MSDGGLVPCGALTGAPAARSRAEHAEHPIHTQGFAYGLRSKSQELWELLRGKNKFFYGGCHLLEGWSVLLMRRLKGYTFINI